MNYQQTFTVTDVARLLKVSKATAYEAVRAGQIPSIRLGKRILIPRIALEKLLGGTLDDQITSPEEGIG